MDCRSRFRSSSVRQRLWPWILLLKSGGELLTGTISSSVWTSSESEASSAATSDFSGLVGFFAFRSFLGLRSSLMIAGISSIGVCAKAVISASVALICPVSISSIAPGTAASAASTPFAYFSARRTNIGVTPFLAAIRSQVRPSADLMWSFWAHEVNLPDSSCSRWIDPPTESFSFS